MTKYKKVKIIATLGPASENQETIESLINEGVDIFRFNLTHSNKEETVNRTKMIRKAEKKLGRPVSIMGDLGGPKIRTGEVAEERMLKVGDVLNILDNESKEENSITINFPEILKELAVGAEIYLGDGMPKLQVKKIIKNGVAAKVIVGGLLKSKMGFAAQGLAIRSVKLSKRDSDFVKLMAELNIDSMAVSFVQSGKDILEVKKLFPKGYAPHVVAKIETLAGVKNIDEILKEADGIMVARGDLGFAVPMEELPLIQKQLIKLGMAHSKPVIVATQMLESMTNSHLPTRAEISDVANAILDRTDAVMLSGETARGKYPVEAVKVMTKIINRMTDSIEPAEFKESKRVSDAMSASAVKIADQVGAKLIIVFSETGASARRVSRHRNSQPIIALSPNKLTIHKLNFSWGVRAYFGPRVESFKAALPQAIKLAKDNPIMKLSKGEPFVICAGLSFGKAGTTNMVLVERV